MYMGLHVRYTLFLSDFNETCIYLTDFLNILRSVGTEIFHVDGQTQTERHDGGNNRFSQYSERP